MVGDRIADMLTRIRNANQMRYETVEVLGSKATLGIAEILKREGYIADFVYEKNIKGDKLNITLKYGAKRERVITGLKRISKSGLRVYAKTDEIPREAGLGGEVLAYIW